jgi:hypothetical protein
MLLHTQQTHKPIWAIINQNHNHHHHHHQLTGLATASIALSPSPPLAVVLSWSRVPLLFLCPILLDSPRLARPVRTWDSSANKHRLLSTGCAPFAFHSAARCCPDLDRPGQSACFGFCCHSLRSALSSTSALLCGVGVELRYDSTRKPPSQGLHLLHITDLDHISSSP